MAALPLADGARCAVCWVPGGSPCSRCAAQPPAFAALRAPFHMAGAARRALLEAKYRSVTALLRPLGEAAAAIVPREWQPQLVVPVPMHPRRQRRRGYNQAELTARAVADSLALLLDVRLLERSRDTLAQAGLTAEQRAHNLDGALAVRARPLACVLLVDDVTTTGATFEAAARALRAGGAEHVFALALARED